MNQNNPFAKLGALDQKLYQETSLNQKEIKAEKGIGKQPEQKSGEDNFLLANQQTSKVANKQTSKPANLQTSKPANQQNSTLHKGKEKVWNLPARRQYFSYPG